jgi:hypothetical protein
MALNQTIVSPLTNITGSLSSFNSRLGNILQIDSSSLPTYQATGWQYKILTDPFTTTSTGQVDVTNLQLTLTNSKKYIVNGYLFASSNRTAVGIRIGITIANTETYYVIETPVTITGIGYAFNVTNVAGSTPSTTITDYSLIEIRAIAIAAASGIATFTPNISSENGENVRIGLGVLYYREY